MVQYIQPICWLLPMNCLGILDDLVWPGLQRLKVMSVALIILLKLVHMCIYIATKNSFYDNSTFLNYSVFLTLTVIKPFCITCITICTWKRNTLRDILLSFCFLEKQLIFCTIDKFFSMCFFWTINFGTLLILPCLHFLLLISCNCESTSTDFKFKVSDFRFKLSCCLCLVPQWLFQNYLPSLPLKMINQIFHLDQLVNDHFP